MIVCSCNIISDKDIEAVIRELLAKDPWRLVVPVQIYRMMEKRGKCCGCFPNVVSIILRVTEAVHREIATPEPERVTHLRLVHSEHQKRHSLRAQMRNGRAA
jgi:bacterioferritin-associated ferredoxin